MTGDGIPDDLRDMPPPADLPRRVAEVVVALLQAWTCIPPGWRPGLAEIHLYDSDRASPADTRQALAEARDRGLAVYGEAGWRPTARAEELRVYLDDWFHAV